MKLHALKSSLGWADGIDPDTFRILRNAWRDQAKVRVHCPGCGRLLDKWHVEATYYGVDYDALAEDEEPEPTGFQLVDTKVTSGPVKVGYGPKARGTIAHYQPWGQHEQRDAGIEGRPRETYICGEHGPGCGAKPTVLIATRERLFLQTYMTGSRDVTLD